MMIARLRFLATTIALYIVGVGTIGALAAQSTIFRGTVHAEVSSSTKQAPHKPVTHRFMLLSGKPVRIVLPDSGIDLPIDDGYYDATSQSWTLSKTHAQFAMMTTLANNATGTTFIYGHGTDEVFGKIGTTHPNQGAKALVYTDTGRVFSYTFQDAKDMTPKDTGVLYDTTGPPTLIIQTCTGAFSEWRTMFRFTFDKVVQ